MSAFGASKQEEGAAYEAGEDCAVLHSGAGNWNDVSCAGTEFGTGLISLICEPP